MHIRLIRLSLPVIAAIITASFLTAGVPQVPTAALTRESVLEAWEQVQAADTQTLRFEEVGEKRYRFKTERFPYDGELHVVNVAIDDLGAIEFEEEPSRIAIVEVELVDMPREYRERHIQSIGMWERNNTLYYDAETETWLSFGEWRDALAAKYPSNYGGGGTGWLWTCAQYSNWIFIGGLTVLVIILGLVARQASKQIQKTMAAQDKVMKEHEEAIRRQEEAIQLTKSALAANQQSVQLLGSILEELKRSA